MTYKTILQSVYQQLRDRARELTVSSRVWRESAKNKREPENIRNYRIEKAREESREAREYRKAAEKVGELLENLRRRKEQSPSAQAQAPTTSTQDKAATSIAEKAK